MQQTVHRSLLRISDLHEPAQTPGALFYSRPTQNAQTSPSKDFTNYTCSCIGSSDVFEGANQLNQLAKVFGCDEILQKHETADRCASSPSRPSRNTPVLVGDPELNVAAVLGVIECF